MHRPLGFLAAAAPARGLNACAGSTVAPGGCKSTICDMNSGCR